MSGGRAASIVSVRDPYAAGPARGSSLTRSAETPESRRAPTQPARQCGKPQAAGGLLARGPTQARTVD
eukprot:315227-Rhodomonas_salina.1